MCSYLFCNLGFLLHTYCFNYLTDHDHLKCFVHVGKSTAKNNFEKGILSNLYDVGEGLAPIIFNLPENTGFDEFYSKCILVLDALKRRSYLTNNMVIICYVIRCIFVALIYCGIKITRA